MLGQTCTQMMGRVVQRLVILATITLSASACQPALTTFRPPKYPEIQRFIEDQGITLVADHLLDDSTALLYEDSTSFGYYIVTVQETDGALESTNVSSAKSEETVLVIGQLTEDLPILAVVIQDAALADKTTAIEVSIDSQNRLTSTTNGQVGAIIVAPFPVTEWRTVTLYNAQGLVIYSQERTW